MNLEAIFTSRPASVLFNYYVGFERNRFFSQIFFLSHSTRDFHNYSGHKFPSSNMESDFENHFLIRLDDNLARSQSAKQIMDGNPRLILEYRKVLHGGMMQKKIYIYSYITHTNISSPQPAN